MASNNLIAQSAVSQSSYGKFQIDTMGPAIRRIQGSGGRAFFRAYLTFMNPLLTYRPTALRVRIYAPGNRNPVADSGWMPNL